MKRNLSKLCLAVYAAAIAGAALAAPTTSGTADMTVSASITDQCSVGNAAELAFGTLTMFANGSVSTADESATATFDAICTNGAASPQLKFTSANAGATSTFLLLGADATTTIAYTLADGATPIAYDTLAGFTGFVADGTTKTLTLTGTIAAAAKAGKTTQSYSDTITITTAFGV